MASDVAKQEMEDQSRAKVFISYSRKDMAFADRLEAALKARGFEPLLDRTDILAFEEWWKRVQALIGRADTIVFVLSPDAVRPGTVALKEVAFAASLNKRFAPIIFRPVEDKSVPEEGVMRLDDALNSGRRNHDCDSAAITGADAETEPKMPPWAAIILRPIS
jgi:TIR domain